MGAPRAGRRLQVFGNCRQGSWEQHLLPLHTGAVCLDGSAAGFYYFKSPSPSHREFNRSWLLFFEGGGWCVSPDECAARATTARGSSRAWPNQTSFGGLLHKCCYFTRFCQFHRVYLKSCDGLGFAGSHAWAAASAAEPSRRAAVVSAGPAIVRAAVELLLARLGLAEARDVLVAGCSAGGRAALLHAPAIRELLRGAGAPLRKFKVLGLGSVFFPPANDIAAAAGHMRTIARRDTAIAGSESCLARHPANQSWRCVWGLEPVERMPADIPVFLVQSVFDLWQTSCILAAGASAESFEGGCSKAPLGRCLRWGHVVRPPAGMDRACADDHLTHINQYQLANVRLLSQSEALRRPGYGGFFHACHDHCPTSDALVRLTIGNLTAREAMHRWFHADPRAAAAAHTRWGCIPTRSRDPRPPSTVVEVDWGQGSGGAITRVVPYGQCKSGCGTSEDMGRLHTARRGTLSRGTGLPSGLLGKSI
ncbi:hypothetical protein AB1Y20_021832 [Prymnesium parvum]|uniref:Pectin acetylesterase n=1 Tax=Prymnesium parvum TaxID=97485 RepID=A0AB34JJV3_PRYPA